MVGGERWEEKIPQITDILTKTAVKDACFVLRL
jgi:hypothetical protein